MALFEDGKIHIPKKKAEPKPVAPDVFKPQPPAVVQKVITAKKAAPPTPPKVTTPKPTVTLAPETITRIEEYKEKKAVTPTPARGPVGIPSTPATPISTSEYQQTMYEQMQESGQAQQQFMEQKASIDETAFYRVEGEPGFLPGSEVKARYYSPKTQKEFEEYSTSAQLAYQQSTKLDKRTTITEKNGMYAFVLPDTSLDFTRETFKKIDWAYEQSPVLGAVAEFGYGAMSSFGSLTKPIADYAGNLFGTKKRDVHMVSPLDVAFEPMGLSPKGSTQILKERPIFAAGGIGGEVLQTFAMSEALKPISAGIKITTKGFVKNLPSIGVKFSQVFPDEKIITGIGRKAWQTSFSKNIYGWAAKGMKKGKVFIQAPTKTFKKGGFNVIQTTYKSTGKKVWMTPEQIALHEARMKAGQILKIGFPTSRTTAGVGKIEMVGDITKYNVGFKKLTRTYSFFRGEKTVGTQAGKITSPQVWLTASIKEAGTQPTKTAWYQFVQAYYGIPKQSYLRPGFVIEKEWHKVALGAKKLPRKFMSSIIGTQSLVPTIKRPSSLYRIGKTIGKVGTRGLQTVTIPTMQFSGVAFTPLVSGVVHVSARALTQQQQQISISSMDQRKIVSQIPSLSYAQEYAQTSIQAQVQLQQQAQVQAQEQKIKHAIATTLLSSAPTKTVGIKPFSPIPSTAKIKTIPFFWSFPGDGSRGRSKKLSPYKPSGYRIRTWKVPSMEQFLKGGIY